MSEYRAPLEDMRFVLRELAGMVYRDRGVDWLLDGLRLVPVLPCRAQAGLGDAIAVGGIDGQLGAPVRWSAGQGYLTAGHVGQALGTVAVQRNEAGLEDGIGHGQSRRKQA